MVKHSLIAAAAAVCDIIGLSYYPWWHGSLLDLRDNVLSILENYPAKDVIVVEVGYRPHEYTEGELAPFPADAPGGPRAAFLEAVNETAARDL